MFIGSASMLLAEAGEILDGPPTNTLTFVSPTSSEALRSKRYHPVATLDKTAAEKFSSDAFISTG
jgi:hypothetical protein